MCGGWAASCLTLGPKSVGGSSYVHLHLYKLNSVKHDTVSIEKQASANKFVRICWKFELSWVRDRALAKSRIFFFKLVV